MFTTKHFAPRAILTVLLTIILAATNEQALAAKSAPKTKKPEAEQPADPPEKKEPKPEKKAKDESVDAEARLGDGLKIISDDKDYSYQIGGRIQVDSRMFKFTPDQKSDVPDRSMFDIRRSRLELKAKIAKFYEAKVSADFGGSKSNLKDAYINYAFFPKANIELGQFDLPFGTEPLGSSKYHEFIESSAIGAAIGGGSDRGMFVHGKVASGRAYYYVGVVNGSSDNLADNNDGFDRLARVVWNPPKDADDEDTRFWLGVSYQAGTQGAIAGETDSISIKTESKSGLTFLKVSLPPDRLYDRTKTGLDFTLTRGPFMGRFEYYKQTIKYDQSAAIDGAYLAASYFVTGETRTIKYGQFERQNVEEAFDPEDDGNGAIELTARYSMFAADEALFTSGSIISGGSALAAKGKVPNKSNGGRAMTLGVNWYPEKMSRIMLNYITSYQTNDMVSSWSKARSASATKIESAWLLRFQIEL